MKTIGFILITAGILMFALTGISNGAKTKSVITPSGATGKPNPTSSMNTSLPWSPILGAGLFVVGILVVVLGKK